ncbi:ABC transporter permease [Xanthomonadaceae bacterium JHOS43]|nr:ABC transporter permease [Xanthomonadaceae bacterium JHOS43]MCX7562644.1 ABC transporter permease [Xanthomonadaceae bacterium XH05]
MLWLLVQQDLRQRFTGNVLGAAWAVLAPLLQLLVFALVFVHIFKARVPGLDERGYVAFLALGMWPWFAFSEAVARGATALTDSAGLLGKVAVSTWLVVAARVISAFIVHGVGFVLVAVLLTVWQGQVSLGWWPLTLPAWIGMFALALALAQIGAICNVFARDTQQILNYLLTAWMFLTPILYARSLVPAMFEPWMQINPMAGLIAAIRDPLLWREAGAVFPFASLIVAAVALLLAWAMHRRFRPHVREFL